MREIFQPGKKIDDPREAEGCEAEFCTQVRSVRLVGNPNMSRREKTNDFSLPPHPRRRERETWHMHYLNVREPVGWKTWAFPRFFGKNKEHTEPSRTKDFRASEYVDDMAFVPILFLVFPFPRRGLLSRGTLF